VNVTEQFAEGLATLGQLEAAHTEAASEAESWRSEAYSAWARYSHGGCSSSYADCGKEAALQEGFAASAQAAAEAAWIPDQTEDSVTVTMRVIRLLQESQASSNAGEEQVRLLREIVAYSPPLREEAWLAWNNAAVVALAQRIYQDQTFDHLPILADALENAGCTDAAILNHLRGPGPHVKGCFVLDLLLDKT
jgi:hypothetical protein